VGARWVSSCCVGGGGGVVEGDNWTGGVG
jgi:hypothetical protein